MRYSITLLVVHPFFSLLDLPAFTTKAVPIQIHQFLQFDGKPSRQNIDEIRTIADSLYDSGDFDHYSQLIDTAFILFEWKAPEKLEKSMFLRQPTSTSSTNLNAITGAKLKLKAKAKLECILLMVE